ncbi:hypothetical protein DNC80_15690 [Flavobacterium sp. SOK18b]|uniref:GAF domain-containing sensor histidine kinase n=1 Tax=Flavobacterium sp. SOK18b TaxID=797900 RepID=UPI0015FD6DB4|nr:PAS domain S-box protein [Flavobacterium sp. SOK18b]MBB1195105.1 hypothetical protein [Flavobacterium sp. SOK18b]
MKKPEILKNEIERLKELESYKIIGELEDFDYDFLTQMASQICGTKISMISLITDEKQWFLSHNGMEARETPKEFAFCAHAINSPEEVFVIEDSRKDERFYDNPLVTGDPNVIFYAGVPLVNENGFALGTLCVIDNYPKKLNEQQIMSLKMLSRQVMKLLELRRRSNELDKINAKLLKTSVLFNESQRINKIGAWELDLVTGITDWTDEVYSIHDVGVDFDHNKASAISFYHPDDQHIIVNAIEQTIATKIPFDVKCRLISNKGILKWVRSTGIFWQEIGGNPKLIGSFQDISSTIRIKEELEEAHAENLAILNASTQVSIISTDTSGVITSFNRGSELQLGYTANEMIGKHTPQIIHLKEEVENVGKELSAKHNTKIEGFDIFVTHAKAGLYETREWTYVRKDGSTYSVLLSVTAVKRNEMITGFLGVGIDITEIKKAEKEILALLDITRDQNERLKNFAYIVSHNLRSHSGGISMLLDFFKEDSPEIYENELFQHFENASDSLSETIKHLTEVVQINLGTIENATLTLLRPVIEKNISSLLPLAIEAGVSLQNEVPDYIKVLAIPAYLESIVLNFISNGIKYSSKEKNSYLKISAELTDDFLILIFKDNGLGIDLPRHRNKLFGIYKTFHGNKDSRGVGLFITKNQVESMGGRIEVESEINIGTTFKVFLKNEKN